jgi:sirohydrochlorin ferrochelatase
MLQDIVNDRINGCLKHGAEDAKECSVCDGTGKCILNQEAASQRNV